jgi:hypothetical protein
MNARIDINAQLKGSISPTTLKVKQYLESNRVHEVEPLRSKLSVVAIERHARNGCWVCSLAQMKYRRRRVAQIVLLLILMLWVLIQIKVWKDCHNDDIGIVQPIERYINDFDMSSVVKKSPTNATKHQRTTELLQFSTMNNENHQIDSYSGMWWVRRDVFVSKWNATSRCANYEAASFKLFNEVTDDNIYMTKDWLDFSVEHLSHYFKQLDAVSLPTFEGMIRRFLQAPTKKNSKSRHSVFHYTLAVLPIYFSDSDALCDWDISLDDVENYKGQVRCLYMYSLSATLKSLWQSGIRRVVLAGNLGDHVPIVQQAISTFWNFGPGQDGSNMDIQYVYVPGEGISNNMPCNTLDQLQAALSYYMTNGERAQWLGEKQDVQDGWRYVYFSEPDLLLHSRLSAVPALQQALDDGQLLTAHRLQLMKHEVDAPPNHPNPYSLFLPNYQQFADFIDLDGGDGGDSCCDAGNWWPGMDDYPKCNNWWYLCGFIDDDENEIIESREQAYRTHQRLMKYPNIRLRNGMTVPVVHAHGRVCIPKRSTDGGCHSESNVETSS